MMSCVCGRESVCVGSNSSLDLMFMPSRSLGLAHSVEQGSELHSRCPVLARVMRVRVCVYVCVCVSNSSPDLIFMPSHDVLCLHA